jgi:hypothetical protein
MANYYKTIVQSALLYAARTWHTPNEALIPLILFHNYVIRHISNRHIKKLPNTDIWVYPNMAKAFQELKMLPIQDYIQKRRKNIYH